MNDLNAAPSSTEQAAAEIQPQTEAVSAAPEVAAAPAGETSAASAAAEPSATSDTTTAAPVESATTQVAAEVPNADAPTAPAGDATPAAGDPVITSGPTIADAVAGEDPNAAASVAVESPVESSPSATNALSGAGESLIAANTPADVPLHVSIAQHLEAIYQLAKSHVDAPAQTMSEATSDVKSHIGDILHKIQNGIAVQSGEMVQKLEALFHKL